MFKKYGMKLASQKVGLNLLSKAGALFLFGVILVSCEIQDNAKKSAENSGRAADNSEKVGNLSEQAYLDGRQAAARRSRAEEWTILNLPSSLTNKLVAAGAYYSSFEFQLWKNSGILSDTSESRETLYAEGLREFFRQVEYAGTYFDLTSGDSFDLSSALKDQTEQSNEKRVLFALAATLDKVSNRQEEASKKYRFTATNLFSLLTEGMSLGKSLSSGKIKLEDLKPYQQELLFNLEKINTLLQARQAFLVQSLLSQVASVAIPDPQTGTWKIDYSKLNLLKKEALIRYLKGTLQVRMILADVNTKPLIPSAVVGKILAMDPAPETSEANKGDSRTDELFKLFSALKTSQK